MYFASTLYFTFNKKRFIPLIFFLVLTASCKNEPSEGDGSSVFAKDKVQNLGSPDAINKELTSAQRKLFNSDSVSEFYKSREYEPVWSKDELREGLISEIEQASDEGLIFEDYHGAEIKQRIKNLKTLNTVEKSQLDILLTDAYFKFGHHLYNGKTDPKDFHEIWDVPKAQVNKTVLLESAIEENNIKGVINKLRPSHPVYRGSIASSKEYKKLKSDFTGFKKISEGELIKPGMEDNRLLEIQFRLQFFGYLDSVVVGNSTNSKEVQEAIKKFQKDYGLSSDGVIGNSTINELNKGYDQRYDQIQVNLERWRWYPRDLGDHYIVINIPNYILHVVKDNDTVISHKTMVGTKSRKTPIFSEEVKHVVFNPTWTIPPTIKNKDVIPGMRNNPDYLSNKNINVYNSNGEELNPSSINWSGSEVKNLVYRQNAGSTNPLGRVKIIYPNKHLIYLHDTPSKQLFERNTRDQSSGCVRVEDAIGLAKYLLNNQSDLSENIDEIISSGKTKQIQVKQKVKVHHFYWTSWRENGKTLFTQDIYNYDNNILEALKKAS